MNKGRKLTICLIFFVRNECTERYNFWRIYKYNAEYNNIWCRSVGNKRENKNNFLATETDFWRRCCGKTKLEIIYKRNN